MNRTSRTLLGTCLVALSLWLWALALGSGLDVAARAREWEGGLDSSPAMSIGVGLKGALLPVERFGLDGAFIHLRMGDFLGIEGLTAVIEGGLSSGLRVVSLGVKLLMTKFPLDGSVLIPFTGGGLGLELATLAVIPEGVAGVEYLAPPFLLLGEMRVQSLKGMTILIGVGLEF